MPVTPEVTPSVDVPLSITPQQMGAGLGQAEARIGDTASDIHFAAVEHANQTAVLDADNQVQQAVQQGLYDPKTGVLNQKAGKDAPGLVDNALSQYDSQVSKVASGLANDRQRAQFQQLAQERRFHVEHQLGQYEHAETTRYADEVDKASVDNAAVAAEQATDPSQVEDAIGIQMAVVADAGKRNGHPPEAIQAQQAEVASGTYARTILALADRGDSVAAADAAKRWGDKLIGSDARQVRNTLRVAVSNTDSRSVADEIIGGQGENADLQGSLDALEKRNITDTEVYDKAKDRIVNHFRLANEAETARQGSLYETAADAIDQSPNPADPGSVPPSVWADMKPAYRNKARAYAKARAQGVDLVTDRRLYQELVLQRAHDPMAFAKRDLVAEHLSKADFERFQGDQAEIAKGSSKLVASFKTNAQEIDQAMLQGGMTPTKSGKKMSDDEVAFRDQLGNAVTAEQQATGKEVSPTRVGEIATSLLQKTVLARNVRPEPLSGIDPWATLKTLFSSGKTSYAHAFQSPVAQKLAYSPAQVPPDAARRHRQALIAAGYVNPTEEQIRTRYNEDLVEAYRDGE